VRHLGAALIARQSGAEALTLQVSREEKDEPRLMTLPEIAEYCRVSYWMVRDWVAAGLLLRVELPCGRVKRKSHGALTLEAGDTRTRKILVDHVDMDALIDQSKEGK